MFNQPKAKSRLQAEIDKLVTELGDHRPNSDEYGETVERLSKLHKMQQDNKPASVDPNTALSVAANLIGITMIIHHEHLHPITSKALSFVYKPR